MNANPEKYIGVTNSMKCGLTATIIAYRKYTDIDVQFEDGSIREHVSLTEFKRGQLSCYKDKSGICESKYLYKTNTMNNNMKATIIAYHRYDDIDIQFEDGTVREHITVSSFNKGTVSYSEKDLTKYYIGMSQNMKCGLKATIIRYKNCGDIDIRFEDGTIRKHVSVNNFKNGEIVPVKSASLAENKQNRTGITRTMNCGIKATVITYRASNDIDVQFENGEIRKHIQFDNFSNGSIAPENYEQILAEQKYLGASKLMNCGMKATIIAYKSSTDVDVQFEDGTVCQNKAVHNFATGSIIPPSLKSHQRVTGTLFDMFTVHNKAFVYHDTAYFDVSYIDDNIELRDIMSVQDMKNRAGIQAH